MLKERTTTFCDLEDVIHLDKKCFFMTNYKRLYYIILEQLAPNQFTKSNVLWLMSEWFNLILEKETKRNKNANQSHLVLLYHYSENLTRCHICFSFTEPNNKLITKHTSNHQVHKINDN